MTPKGVILTPEQIKILEDADWVVPKIHKEGKPFYFVTVKRGEDRIQVPVETFEDVLEEVVTGKMLKYS